jgi:hypothetical protein
LDWKTPRVRPRYRWEDNIKIVVKEIEWEDVECIILAQGRDK